MLTPDEDELFRALHVAIVERRIYESSWWREEHMQAWARSYRTGSEVDRQITGIIKATLDAFKSDDSTIEYIESTRLRERRARRVLRRIRNKRRSRRVGSFIVRCLECIGRCHWPGIPGTAPR